jgi:hypothetical protein
MRRETVTVANDLDEVLEAFRRDKGRPNDFSALVDAALRQYLRVRGYVAASDYRPLRLTPDEDGSGRTDVSVEHDRYLYDTPE